MMSLHFQTSDCIRELNGVLYCINTGITFRIDRQPIFCVCDAKKNNAKIKPQYGPGTELRILLHKWGFSPVKKCLCKQFEDMMNFWGIDGCLERLENRIIPWLVKQFKERKQNQEGLNSLAKTIVRITPEQASPLLARRLVKQAIRYAKKKSANND